jgi:hypothetical protein
MQLKTFIFALLFVSACAIPSNRPYSPTQQTETLSTETIAQIAQIVQDSVQAAVETAMDQYYVQHAQALDRLTAEVREASVTHTSQYLEIIQYIMKLAPVEKPEEPTVQQSLRGQRVSVPYEERVSVPYEERVSVPYEERVNVPYEERVSVPYEERVSVPHDEEEPSEVPYDEDVP